MEAAEAETYAEWFACLADPTRIRILHLLARERRAMKVGEIVERMDVGQSTVSYHLKRLAETGFVLAEREGTASWFRVNERCLSCFPTAADVVMGVVDLPASVTASRVIPPWAWPDDTSQEVRDGQPPGR